MKNFIFVLAFIFGTSATAFANNGKGKNNPGDPKKKTEKKNYEISVSKSYFSFFNLFAIEPVKSDSLIIKEKGDSIRQEKSF